MRRAGNPASMEDDVCLARVGAVLTAHDAAAHRLSLELESGPLPLLRAARAHLVGPVSRGDLGAAVFEVARARRRLGRALDEATGPMLPVTVAGAAEALRLSVALERQLICLAHSAAGSDPAGCRAAVERAVDALQEARRVLHDPVHDADGLAPALRGLLARHGRTGTVTVTARDMEAAEEDLLLAAAADLVDEPGPLAIEVSRTDGHVAACFSQTGSSLARATVRARLLACGGRMETTPRGLELVLPAPPAAV